MDSKKSLFIRVAGDTLKTETTEDEKNFRETQFAEAKSVLKKSLNCTACGKNLRDKVVNKDIHVHPVLEVLWCKKCEEFYSDGEFSADEDGSDKYCRWCAQGGELYCCSHCSVAFCKKCVKRNLPKQTLKDIEDDDWKCFVCVTEPLWKLRGICDAAKRYANFDSNSRKSTRRAKNHSEEDTAESDVSNTRRTKRKGKSTSDSTGDEKYNADSEDTSSLGTNKNKRKYASSSEDTSNERKARRRKVSNEEAKQPNPDVKNKEKFEAIMANTLNEFAVLRKLLTKKETAWKKNYFAFNVTKLSEIASQAKEELPKVCSDIKTSITLIEKSFTDKFEVFENELNKSKDKTELSPIKENDVTNDAPEVQDEDEEMADVSIIKETCAEEKPEEVPPKSSDISVNGTEDMSMTIFNDDSMPGVNDKPNETDTSRKSISDSLAVNVSSIIDSLNSDEENELRNQNNTVKEIDSIDIEPSKPDDGTESDTQVIVSDKNDDDEVTITEPAKEKEVTFVEKDAKLSLLQSSSDNNTTDVEATKKLSTDSELSGVDVLHSDQDDVVKTKGAQHHQTMRVIEAT